MSDEADGVTPLVYSTIFLPSKWNQGSFVFAYYCLINDKKTLLFFNATLAPTHDYKFEYLGEFMHQAVGTVTSKELFPAHNPKGGKTDGVEYVQNQLSLAMCRNYGLSTEKVLLLGLTNQYDLLVGC